MQFEEETASMIVAPPQCFESWSEQRLKKDLEFGDIAQKTEALKSLIFTLASGQKLAKDVLMYVIRFLLPISDKHLKKMLLLFWELVPKYANNKLLPEMILVCDAYRKDLLHPNEYVRGSILRFLCRLKNPEILEPILPAIRACLEHKTAYVRKNAVLAIFTIYKNFDELIPDAPELLERFLDREEDCACQRNAFMMLIHCDQKRAVDYLKLRLTNISKCNEILQLAIIDLLYNYCTNSNTSSVWLHNLFELGVSPCKAVAFAAANAIISLSETRASYEFAIKTYVNLLTKESDNNARIILINQLVKINSSKKFDYIFREVSFDMLMVLNVGSSGAIVDLEVAKKLLGLVINILPAEHCTSAVGFIKKELERVQKLWASISDNFRVIANRDIIDYDRLLVNFIKSLLERHAEIHNKVLPMLVNNISSAHASVASDILEIIRNIIVDFPHSREYVFHELGLILTSINDVDIYLSSLWIMVVCTVSSENVKSIINLLDSMIVKDHNNTEIRYSEPAKKSNVMISADGSYVTVPSEVISSKYTSAIINKFILEGHTHVCSSISTIIIKLNVFITRLFKDIVTVKNILTVKLMNILAKMVHFYQQKYENLENIDIQKCLGVLQIIAEEIGIYPIVRECEYMSNEKNELDIKSQLINKDKLNLKLEEFLNLSFDATKDCIKVKETIIDSENKNNAELESQEATSWTVSFDSIIETKDKNKKQNIYDESLLVATGKLNNHRDIGISQKVAALTGMSDPIYAETSVKVSNFDIRFDVLIVNQTADSLQNVSVDMRTQGEYQIIYRSPPVFLAPYKFTNVNVCLRLSSSESHVVFGSIYYDTSGPVRESYSVILDETVLDLTETASTQKISPSSFQKMWADFEWENKVPVSLPINNFDDFIEKILQNSKMCLIQENENSQDCRYLVSNMYSKNLFGDEAVANISVEKSDETGQIYGQVRIRAKSQTIAITLGQRFTDIMKEET